MFEAQLVSPERILYTGEATQVLCRTVGGGDIAFLTGHAPFIGALDIWAVKITTTDDRSSGSPCTAASSRSPTTRSSSCRTWPRRPIRSTSSVPAAPRSGPSPSCARIRTTTS